MLYSNLSDGKCTGLETDISQKARKTAGLQVWNAQAHACLQAGALAEEDTSHWHSTCLQVRLCHFHELGDENGCFPVQCNNHADFRPHKLADDARLKLICK